MASQDPRKRKPDDLYDDLYDNSPVYKKTRTDDTSNQKFLKDPPQKAPTAAPRAATSALSATSSRATATSSRAAPIDEIKSSLEKFGQEISESPAFLTEEEAEEQYKALQSRFELAIREQIDQTKQQIQKKQSAISATNLAKMQRAEAEELQKRTNAFLSKMVELSARADLDLTPGQSEALRRNMINYMITAFAEAQGLGQEGDPNQLARFSELASIMYSCASSFISSSISIAYEQGPEKIRQLMALITAIGMAYNYVPEGGRSALTSIPTFGPLFALMNKINPQMLALQNAAFTSTGMYYMLRNAGMPLDETLSSVKEFTQATATICGRSGKEVACVVGEAAKKGVTESTNRISATLSKGANKIMDSVGGVLSQLVVMIHPSMIPTTRGDSQEMSSQGSISIHSTSTQLSLSSMRSVGSLFGSYDADAPQEILDQGIISLAGTSEPENITEQRFVALNDAVSNPANPGPIIIGEVAPIAIAVSAVAADPEMNVVGSQDTDLSDLSTDERASWYGWLFGHDVGVEVGTGLEPGASVTNRTTEGVEILSRVPSTGGRGGKRKSKRHKNVNQTKRIKRRLRRGRLTKKGKRHYKTLKRYKAKRRYKM